MHKIRFKRLHEGAIIPQKATIGPIAFDVYVPEDVTLIQGRQIVKLGFAIQLPLGYEAKIEARSGFSAKGMEGIAHDRFDADVITGKVDSGYIGEVGVIVKNNDKPFIIKKGTRIAQMTIYQSEPDWSFEEVDELEQTKRGDGGLAKKEKQIVRCYDCALAYLMRNKNNPIIAGCKVTHEREVAMPLHACPFFKENKATKVIYPLIKAR